MFFEFYLKSGFYPTVPTRGRKKTALKKRGKEKDSMKYRFVISRDDAKKKLIIQEFTRALDSHLTLVGTREIDSDIIEEAIALGPEAVMNKIRTHGMYPPEDVAISIAKLAIKLYGPKRSEISEGHIDEMDAVTPEPEPMEEEESEQEKTEEDVLDEKILDAEGTNILAENNDLKDVPDDKANSPAK